MARYGRFISLEPLADRLPLLQIARCLRWQQIAYVEVGCKTFSGHSAFPVRETMAKTSLPPPEIANVALGLRAPLERP
jgi:hypothetical protein